MTFRKARRVRRKLERRRQRLLGRATGIESDIRWSSDFFAGYVAGPRRREALRAELALVTAEIEDIEATLEKAIW